jgi:hypothetical protein
MLFFTASIRSTTSRPPARLLSGSGVGQSEGSKEHFNALVGLPSDQWKAPVYSVSMTTRLGFATVLGAIAIVVIAHSKDEAPAPKQCKADNCAVSTIDQIIRQKVPKSAQQSNGFTDGQMILNKDGSVQSMAANGSADELASKKPSHRLVKKPARRLAKKPTQRLVENPPRRLVENPPQRLVENPPQRLVEKSPQPQYPRLRRGDDPFLWQESFN